jgi:hypothetical protein
MKSIETSLKTIQEKNPTWSSFVCFAEVIRKGNFKDWKNVVSWFNRLVDKDEYDKSDKKDILIWLQTLAFTNHA